MRDTEKTMSLERDQDGFYKGEWLGKDVRFPSVTTALGLISNYDHVSKDVLERACAFGNAVHRIVELHEHGKLDENSLRPKGKYLADTSGILEAWKKCKREKHIEVYAVEQVVASLKYQYAGRLDVVAKVKGVLALIEIKSRAYNPMLEPLQTSAYANAWDEAHKEKIKERWFCELRLDGGYDFRPIKGKNDFHYFRCCLAAWNWREGNGGK
jgi:hypothetical protein